MSAPLFLNLKYQGGGGFCAATPLDFRLCTERLEQGEIIRVKVSRGRSNKQNRMFHALVQAAFDNQVHGPAGIDSPQRMKSHLLIRAGHCVEERFPMKNLDAKSARAFMAPIAAFLRREFDVIETSYDQRRHEIVVRVAKEWRFAKTDHETATKVMDRVIEEIATSIVPGVSVDQLLDMAKAA